MIKQKCYHCGDSCESDQIHFDKKDFCCHGCKTVYEILHQNELGKYYEIEKTPGTSQKLNSEQFLYLDKDEIVDKLIEFKDEHTSVVSFYVPIIHCSSCIWVLENLNKLNKAVLVSLVNFPKKTVRITFNNEESSLREIVELMASIGYAPYISLEDGTDTKKSIDRRLLYQVTIAGFVFGNVMLLSFPEYFDVDEFWLLQYKNIFRGLILIMSLPVVFYCAQDYFISAYKGLKHKILNIDVPISIGIIVLFVRSVLEISLNWGPGFLDSLTGLVFYLLLGKFFQQRTYSFLSFERDYKSYFPIAITKIKDHVESKIAVQDIVENDRLLIRNEELIPADGILIHGKAMIDYSFVTGESLPIHKKSGDKVFAGGKQIGNAIEIEVLKSISQSYLTQLWSHKVFDKAGENKIQTLTDSISQHFTKVLLAIAILSGGYWFFKDVHIAFNVFTAVLIVACPCALALSAPFAQGNMIRIFGKHKFYLKNAHVIEKMSHLTSLIFDKTGTITTHKQAEISFKGEHPLDQHEKRFLKKIIRNSNHPLSRSIYDRIEEPISESEISLFEEIPGKGIKAVIEGRVFLIGSYDLVAAEKPKDITTSVYIAIDGVVRGEYIFKSQYRKGFENVFKKLSKKFKIAVLSGDNEGEKEFLSSKLPLETNLVFNQKPEDKLSYIASLQDKNEKVMMVGDGLNDAGALAQSDVGVALAENINVFSPACDAIIDASLFEKLPDFIELSKKTMNIIKWSFGFSFSYNIIGLYFAVTGQLTPVIAAILMPISSISVVVFVTVLTNIYAKRISK